MPEFVTIHPMLVHFPIALIVLIAGLDLVAVARRKPLGGRGTVSSLVAALGLALMASTTLALSLGHAAAEYAMGHGVDPAIIIPHLAFGSVAALLLFAWALFRGWIWWKQAPVGRGRTALILAGDAGLVLLVVVTAWLGGQLVYEHGVNVAALALR